MFDYLPKYLSSLLIVFLSQSQTLSLEKSSACFQGKNCQPRCEHCYWSQRDHTWNKALKLNSKSQRDLALDYKVFKAKAFLISQTEEDKR